MPIIFLLRSGFIRGGTSQRSVRDEESKAREADDVEAHRRYSATRESEVYHASTLSNPYEAASNKTLSGIVRGLFLKLKDKTVLVTGGTGGLGKALVRQFLQSGAAVHFTYFQAEPEARGLEDSGARGHKLDLSDMRAVETFAGAFMRETEGLHVLIHNAAATRDRLLRDMTEDDWDYVLKVDLKAPYYLTQQLLPAIRRTAAAKIFMLTSRAAFTGSAGLTNYAAAKAGIIGLVKSLAQELGESGILVNAVNPGFMKSRMTEGLSEEIVERNLSSSPLRAFSDPEEVAGFIVYLASGAMTQVTGQVFSFESRGIAW